MSELFTLPDAWSGGFYELVIELPDSSSSTLQQALSILWANPALDGCFPSSDVEPGDQQRIPVPQYSAHEGHLYGVASFPNGNQCCCGSILSDFQESGCWLEFYLPMGSLGLVYPVGAYPFMSKKAPSPEAWLRALNQWLVEIAQGIYQSLKFSIGFIGCEVDFLDLKKTVTNEIPKERWDGILIDQGKGLAWHPPTIYDPQYS